MSLFKCKGCLEKDKRIVYLEKLVDNLLIKANLSTVYSQELEENYAEPAEQDESVEVIG